MMKLFQKNLLFTLLIPGTVAIYLPWIIGYRGVIRTPGAWLIIGIIFLMIGCAVYFWTVWDFATVGKGTPLPADPPHKLVVRGLYRYVRNPMYWGVILVILGWAAFFAEVRLLIYALAVSVVIHLFVIFYEEPRLRQLFGTDYMAYCEAVGRWLPHFPKGGV